MRPEEETMTLAVLGTGIMGAAMARNWLAAGESVRVWNRTRAKAEPLAEAGAVVAGDPAGAVDGADIVVTMLYDADSVADAMDEAAPGLRPGVLWLQMSTVGVAGAQRLGDLAAKLGLVYVDAPVTGTRQPAEQGQLGVLASGPDEVRQRVEALLDPVAGKVHWLGAAGAGSRLKLVFNSWALNAVTAVAQALALADGLGVDPRTFLELVKGGPLDLGYAHVKGDAMLRRRYPASFAVSGAAKDARLILEACEAAGVDPAGVAVAARLLDEAAELGHRDDDMAAVYEAVAAPTSASAATAG
jgi:3-hydroxyisobutyrate dehydrogenase